MSWNKTTFEAVFGMMSREVRINNHLVSAGTAPRAIVAVRPSTRDRWLALSVTLAFFMLVALLTKTAPKSWNDTSRVAAIESFVTRGTWRIDESPWFELTNDKVLLHDHYYSGKMPLLSALGAGIYAGLNRVSQVALTPTCASGGNGCAYYWLTLLLIGLPAAVTIGLYYHWARAFGISMFIALAGTAALALGTELLPYSLVLNHHVPAAAGLFIAFYLLTVLAPGNDKWLFGVGLAASFAVMCDPLAGVGAVALGLLALRWHRWRSAYVVLGALPPLLLTAWLDLQITGTLIPPYLTPDGYAYMEAGDQRGPAGTGTPDDLPQYAFKMFLGAQGLFAYNPILWFALAGIGIALWQTRLQLRDQALAIGGAWLALALYLALRTGNLGGNGYGERYFVNLIPLVMAFLLFAPPLRATRGRVIFIPVLVAALYLSALSTYQGVKNPWDYMEPPFHLTRDSASGRIGTKWTGARFPVFR